MDHSRAIGIPGVTNDCIPTMLGTIVAQSCQPEIFLWPMVCYPYRSARPSAYVSLTVRLAKTNKTPAVNGNLVSFPALFDMFIVVKRLLPVS